MQNGVAVHVISFCTKDLPTLRAVLVLAQRPRTVSALTDNPCGLALPCFGRKQRLRLSAFVLRDRVAPKDLQNRRRMPRLCPRLITHLGKLGADSSIAIAIFPK